jgi:hypothetical protein
VNEEGEVALRLALHVVAAAAAPGLLPFTVPGVPTAQQRQSSIFNSTRNSSTGGRLEQLQQEAHTFEVGVHLNLTQLVGLPSMQHPDKLSAEQSGLGKAARGVLLIGDMGLNALDMERMPWRAPPVGVGILLKKY